MTDSPNASSSLDSLLGAQASRPWWKRRRLWVAGGISVATACGAWYWQSHSLDAQAPRYVTSPVVRGNLAITVTATGTLQPTRLVAIGSELSGIVSKVLVDVNDPVRKGQLLIELDTSKLRDAVAGAQADVQAATARVRQSAATAAESGAALARQEDLARLSGGKLPSAADLSAARAAAERGTADEAAARASLAQSQATLSTQQTNLAKAAIRSPIDGIVLSRTVEPGNAVAASLQAVTLLTLAEDLRQLKLSVNVDEADVAQISAGQSARFTVAAQPGRQYPATITRVAYGSTTTDNVVTYTTQLEVSNADLSLRPGMTATATIAATERRQVLLVPNSALRYSPGGARGAASGPGLVSKLVPSPPPMGRRGGAGGAGPGARGSSQGTVWVLDGGQPVAMRVNKGLSDGRNTEVTGEGLREGLAVITDQSGGP